MEREECPAAAEVRRKRDRPIRSVHLAAAVELERDEPGELKRPAVYGRCAGHDRVGAAATRRLVGDVERALELGLQRQTVARRRCSRLD